MFISQTREYTNNERSLMVSDPLNKMNYDSESGILQFSFSEFIKIFLYHVLYLQVFGPLACLIIGPIEGYIFLKNSKFWSGDPNCVV